MKDSWDIRAKQVILQCTKCRKVFMRPNPTMHEPKIIDDALSHVVQTDQTPTLNYRKGWAHCPVGHDTEVRLYRNPRKRAETDKEGQEEPVVINI